MLKRNLNSFEQFQNKRVLVTGHTGFKGSWLCLWLSKLGCTIRGYALEAPTEPSNFSVSEVDSVLEKSIVGDLRDYSKLKDAIVEFEPDLVMHLAAQSVVRRGYSHPLETISTNVVGTAHVLEAVREWGRHCAVFCVTSDKCYENLEQPWGYRETDRLGESDPYGASKGAAEIIIRSYQKSFFPFDKLDRHGVWLASGRAGNVIGGGDWTEHGLVADCVRAFHEGRAVEIRNPRAQRPWQHVLQCLSGYLSVSAGLLEAQDTRYCTAWNFGPASGEEYPVQQVVEYLAEFWQNAEWKNNEHLETDHESQILRLSIDKAIWELGWKPTWSVPEAIHKTGQWFQAYFAGNHSMKQMCLEQIQEFEELYFCHADVEAAHRP